jgi:hypothetical protein
MFFRVFMAVLLGRACLLTPFSHGGCRSGTPAEVKSVTLPGGFAFTRAGGKELG